MSITRTEKSMKSPYEILGVPENATDEDIKKAYRELAKKYHPDNYNDSPLADLAEEKMKEINEAYDKICEMRRSGASSSSASGTYGTSGSYTKTSYPDVRAYITNGRLDDALEILNGVSVDMRGAEWYFLMGIIYSRKGWTEQANNYFQEAHRREPSNAEYAAAVNHMNARRTYNNPGYNTNNDNMGCSVCDVCSAIMCADCLCSCCGGGRGC